MLKEAEIKVLILKPSQFKVSINVGAVRISVPGSIILKTCRRLIFDKRKKDREIDH